MPLAGLDKLQGQLATQIVHFFRLAARKGHFCDKSSCNSTFRVSGSLLLTLVHSATVTLAHSDHSRLSLALAGAYRLTRSLLGSLRRSCVAPVYPTLVISLVNILQQSSCECMRCSGLLVSRRETYYICMPIAYSPFQDVKK